MYRVKDSAKAERRLERLATVTPDDNRISYGCINLPASFFEDTLREVVRESGAVVYEPPETLQADEVFGSYVSSSARSSKR